MHIRLLVQTKHFYVMGHRVTPLTREIVLTAGQANWYSRFR